MEYELLVSGDPEHLSKLVNDKLASGYFLYGEPKVVMASTPNDDGQPQADALYAQAVVLTTEEFIGVMPVGGNAR